MLVTVLSVIGILIDFQNEISQKGYRMSNDDELRDERHRSERLEQKLDEQNKINNLLFAGALGLVVYTLSGFSFAGGVIGFLVFIGVSAWRNGGL